MMIVRSINGRYRHNWAVNCDVVVVGPLATSVRQIPSFFLIKKWNKHLHSEHSLHSDLFNLSVMDQLHKTCVPFFMIK